MIEISGGKVRRRDHRIWFLSLGVFFAVFLFTFLSGYFRAIDSDVEAASLANFDPGYIISDYQMGNYTSMSEEEIQSFLTSKNGCNNRDYNYYQRLTASTGDLWHFENGHFICLSEEKFGDGEVIGSGDTAAHIIWQAAQDYKINPQVILVLLQKESSLITDPIPNKIDYRKAAGYGCPDTAACSSKYYGFKNQVRNAAALFRTVLDGGWTNYPLGNNYVQYNPNAACGGSIVNIRSLATSALYRYTPYQPNPGAIAAGYGTASCGAYGNRNFYLYFQDWFGGITDTESIVEATTEHKQTIVEGDYRILIKDSGETVGIEETFSDIKASLSVKKGNARTFTIKYDEESGFYSVIDKDTGLSFDVKGEDTKDGAEIQLYRQKNPASCNQQWLFIPNDQGYYSIVSRCSNKSITKNKEILSLSKKNKTNWLLEPVAQDAELEDGVYNIKADANLTMVSAGNSLRANVFLNNTEQYYKIEKDKKDGLYTIKETKSGRVVDVAGASVLNRSNIQLYNYNGSCNQKWRFVKNNKGFILQSACSGKVIDIAGGSLKAQANIQLYQFNNGDNQIWQIEKIKTGTIREDVEYQIVSSETDKAMDLQGGIKSGLSRGEMVVWNIKQTGTDNQAFKFKYDSDKQLYYIYNPTTNLYLDVSGASTENDAKTILYKYNGNCNQQWHIEYDETSDSFVISSLCSDKALTISDQLSGSSKRVTIYEKGSKEKQHWKLKEINNS